MIHLAVSIISFIIIAIATVWALAIFSYLFVFLMAAFMGFIEFCCRPIDYILHKLGIKL